MTLVEAQARILSLEQELDHRNSEIRSLRTEVADLTAENAGLQSLLAETRGGLEIQSGRIVELERRLNQTSRNSSKPPSSDGPGVDRPRQRGGRAKRKRGGQPGHVGKGRELLPKDQVSRFVDHYPTACAGCGCLLIGDDEAPERIQTIELPPVVPIVEEHRIHSLTCPACGVVTKSDVPADLRASPFGPRLHSVVALMGGLFRLSKREIQAALDILYGAAVGLGSIPKIERRMKEALDVPYDGALQGIRGSPFAHQDTTSWRENKRRVQLWVTATPRLAHYHINARANRPVAKALLGEDYTGVVVTDRAAAQVWDKQQWCWSHLKRDFAALSQIEGGAWYGCRLEACADRVHALYAEYVAGKLSHAAMVRLLNPVKQQVHSLLINAADHAPSERTQRVCKHLLKGESKLWTFLRHKDVPPTNNHGERCVRKVVLWRDVCFGSDSPVGSRYVERILTVVHSLRLQQRDREILDWLVTARLAQINGLPAPSLLPAPTTP